MNTYSTNAVAIRQRIYETSRATTPEYPAYGGTDTTAPGKRSSRNEMQQTNPSALIHIRRNTPVTDSLLIAQEFCKRHDNVLAKIQAGLTSENSEIRKFSFLNFKGRNSIVRGRPTQYYEVTEDGFLELALGFTGSKAKLARIKFIAAFRQALNEISRLQAILNEPGRAAVIADKRASHIGMADAIKLGLELHGKDAKPHYFMTENKLCNWAVRGEFKAIDEITLEAWEAKLLERVRNYNETLLLDGFDYETRKPRLETYAKRQRGYLSPVALLPSAENC